MKCNYAVTSKHFVSYYNYNHSINYNFIFSDVLGTAILAHPNISEKSCSSRLLGGALS